MLEEGFPIAEDFPIGTIVTLHGHPFFKDIDKDGTYISGDALSLPPLMVVTETFPESNANIEEDEKKMYWRCKCTWYSNLTGQFATAELSSVFLKKIVEQSTGLEAEDFVIGSRVILKTNFIELGKKKLSMKLSDSSDGYTNKVATALLAFTSPVMQVIGPYEAKVKNAMENKKASIAKRITSVQLLKCKFYNAIAEKFSEVILPYEALEAIVAVSNNRIEEVNKIIADKCLIKITSPGIVFRNTVMQPLRIIYKSGNYFIEGKDYLENTIIEILLEEDTDQFVVIADILQQMPNYSVQDGKVILSFIDKANLLELPQENYWRIKYKSFNDTVTTRTLYQLSFCDYLESDEKKPKVIDYLQAKCILRNHKERLFRIDRILLVEVLDLAYAENFR